jgi:hypothetical protein
MIRRSLLLFYVLVSAHTLADQDTGEEAEIVEMNTAILRETFAEPVYAELVNGGLAPLLAISASDRLLDGLTECWKSDLNETNWAEPAVTTVQMGGQTIVTYKTPCLEAFLVAVDDAKP